MHIALLIAAQQLLIIVAVILLYGIAIDYSGKVKILQAVLNLIIGRNRFTGRILLLLKIFEL